MEELRKKIIELNKFSVKLGAVPSVRKPNDLSFAAKLSTKVLPKKFDAGKKVKMVFDQGQYSSCTGHATASCVMRFLANTKQKVFVCSRSFPYYNGRLVSELQGDLEVNTKTDNGAYLNCVLESIIKYGICDQSVCGYGKDANIFDKPSAKAYKYAESLSDIRYKRVSNSLHDIKSAIAENNCIVAGITLYESCYSDKTTKTGIFDFPNGDSIIGGHAICIVAYDDDTRLFKFVNSWGDSWGDKGYGYLPYSYLEYNNLAFDLFVINFVKNSDTI